MSEDDIKEEFSHIYDRYINRIYRFVFLKVGSHDMAEDIVAETFTKSWHFFYRSKAGRGKEIRHLSGFLYQTARNLVIDFYRQRGQTNIVTTENVTLVAETDKHMDAVDTGIEMETIQRALSRLKSEYQDVLIWYYLDELSVREISRIMNKSERAVRMQISRALNSLRSEIDVSKLTILERE